MANTALLAWLLNFVSQNRPVVIALLFVALVIVLLRPRAKPDGGQPGPSNGTTSSSTAVRRRTVAISTDGIILRFCDGRPFVIPEMVKPLLTLAAQADVYLITQLPTDTDELEEATRSALAEAQIFGEGRCDACKALFCVTEDGRAAMARQILPTTHIDTSVKVLQYIAPHVTGAVCVNVDRPAISTTKGSIQSVTTLAEYVGVEG